jgi:hypothetical protein
MCTDFILPSGEDSQVKIPARTMDYGNSAKDPTVTELVWAFILNFNILTSLLINCGFGFLGASKLFYTRNKEAPQIEYAFPDPGILTSTAEKNEETER